MFLTLNGNDIPEMISVHDIRCLQEICSLLRPFEVLTREIFTEKSVMIQPSEYRAKFKRQSKVDYSAHISRTEEALSSSPFNFWKFVNNLQQKPTVPL
ncbi:unnamed protein product [Macrosiphum euphorbiae]|nr:unnamed protein product [Macrosiphum euphorbiae]